MSNSNLFLSIGKPIKNEYGRVIGKVASFALTPNGNFDAVFIEFGDGQFSKQPMESLKFNGAEVTFISKIKNQANTLCDHIPLIWRKDQALKELSEKKKIAPELYQEMHDSFENVLAQLKKDAQIVVDDASIEIERCQEEISSLTYAIANLEIEHEIGKIDEDSYRAAFSFLQETLKRATSEKNDYELLGDTLPQNETSEVNNAPKNTKVYAEQVDNSPKLPEPPVVVYVKEVGKAGL
jgi:hypothetical protein